MRVGPVHDCPSPPSPVSVRSMPISIACTILTRNYHLVQLYPGNRLPKPDCVVYLVRIRRARAPKQRARRHIFTTTRVAPGTARGLFSHQQRSLFESRRRGRAPPGRAPPRARPASTTANQRRYPRAAAAPRTVSTSCPRRAPPGCLWSPSRARPQSVPCGSASPAPPPRQRANACPARAALGEGTRPTRGRPRRRPPLRSRVARACAARPARPRPTRR